MPRTCGKPADGAMSDIELLMRGIVLGILTVEPGRAGEGVGEDKVVWINITDRPSGKRLLVGKVDGLPVLDKRSRLEIEVVLVLEGTLKFGKPERW